MVESSLGRPNTYTSIVETLRETKTLNENEEWDEDKGYLYLENDDCTLELTHSGSRGYPDSVSATLVFHTNDDDLIADAKACVKEAMREAGLGHPTDAREHKNKYTYRIELK